ncbi:Transcriptional regulator, ArsR family [hydrothermal vent metagenome]|uniref:Transcriptional regulator, ArsR family n=1 Tax=hydrothermal vent metagenome TaxID=652676 RepID=A0A3B0RTS3_9ZZZZ
MVAITPTSLKFEMSGQNAGESKIIERARTASSQLKAMAHESRLAILFHLYNGPKSVSQLEGLLAMRQPAVSQQLARLRSDQMVATERRGKQIYYSISSEHAFVIVELLHRLYGGQLEQEVLPRVG